MASELPSIMTAHAIGDDKDADGGGDRFVDALQLQDERTILIWLAAPHIASIGIGGHHQMKSIGGGGLSSLWLFNHIGALALDKGVDDIALKDMRFRIAARVGGILMHNIGSIEQFGSAGHTELIALSIFVGAAVPTMLIALMVGD